MIYTWISSAGPDDSIGALFSMLGAPFSSVHKKPSYIHPNTYISTIPNSLLQSHILTPPLQFSLHYRPSLTSAYTARPGSTNSHTSPQMRTYPHPLILPYRATYLHHGSNFQYIPAKSLHQLTQVASGYHSAPIHYPSFRACSRPSYEIFFGYPGLFTTSSPFLLVPKTPLSTSPNLPQPSPLISSLHHHYTIFSHPSASIRFKTSLQTHFFKIPQNIFGAILSTLEI